MLGRSVLGFCHHRVALHEGTATLSSRGSSAGLCAASRGSGSAGSSSIRPASRSQRTPLTPELKKLLVENFGELPSLPKDELPAKQPAQKQKPPTRRAAKPPAAAPPAAESSTKAAPKRRKPKPKPFADLMQSFQQDSVPGSNAASSTTSSSLTKATIDDITQQQDTTPAAASSNGKSSSTGRRDTQPPSQASAADQVSSTSINFSMRSTNTRDFLTTSSTSSVRDTGRPDIRKRNTQPPLQASAAGPARTTASPNTTNTNTFNTTSTATIQPVYKGDLALPGGTNWSHFRNQIQPRTDNPRLPFIDAIIIVEGINDYSAVSRAVSAPAYVCNGSRVYRPVAEREIKALMQLGKDVIVMTDPDEEGLKYRIRLEEIAGPLYHAFIPMNEATSIRSTRYHEAGNRGVEHADAHSIRAALGCVVKSFGDGRKEFSAQDLVDAQVVNLFGAAEVRNVRWRRQLVCGFLGVGRGCSGKGLRSVLNRFFTREQFQAALARAEQELEGLLAEVEEERK